MGRPRIDTDVDWLSSSMRVGLVRVTSEPTGQSDTSAGTISVFSQHLDIGAGVLSTTLGLDVAGTPFTSQRTEFVTPQGVWVIRVSDSAEATQPMLLEVSPKMSYAFSGEAKTNGMVITATAANACNAALAVACEGVGAVDVNAYTATGDTDVVGYLQ